ncbi:unnamed protein product [Symbiodinium sp. CCMP2592]|nr:unnamed protein product [Symbiodinium sp. CCMP2592]
MLEPALQVIRLVAQGAQSNWFGIGCPSHCRGADLGLLLASFLLGFLVATVAWISLLAFLAYRPSVPTQVTSEAPPEPPLESIAGPRAPGSSGVSAAKADRPRLIVGSVAPSPAGELGPPTLVSRLETVVSEPPSHILDLGQEPCVLTSFAAFRAHLGRLEGHHERDPAFCMCRSVEIVELSWPMLQDLEIDQAPEACLAYAVMRRPGGFLLCVPSGFFRASDLLAGQSANEDSALMGPSIEYLVTPVVLTEAGDWARADDPAPVPCVVVDLAFRAADAVTQADLADTGARPFLADRIRSGYQTAVSEAPARAAKLGARPKKTTVAQLAAQQESFAKALAGISEQLALLAKPPAVEQGAVDGGPAAPLPRAAAPPTSALLSAPVSGKAPQQGFPAKALSSLLGPPPRAKAAPTPVIHQLEEDDPLHLETGGAQEAGGTNTPVAEAMLLQSRALAQLVSQLAQNADPLADLGTPASTLSTRGTNSRQRMQSELALREGHFATRMRVAALRHMAPTALEPALHQEGLMTRYLERFGGYQGQQLVGLLQWQLAQISADLAAQAMIMLEQVAVDRGRHELGWLFTLQPDPPVSLFATHHATPTAALRPFAPLADAKLVSCTIAFMKELDNLSAKRLELSGAKGKPPPAPPPTDDGGTPEPPLSKKQQRARAWAAAKKGGEPRHHAPPARETPVPFEDDALSCAHGSAPRSGSALSVAPTPRPKEEAGRCTASSAAPGFSDKIDFWAWAAALPRLLLATKTAFARFFAGTMHLRREDHSPSAALFPLPLPRPGAFGREDSGHAKVSRQVLLDRVLHMCVMALNFMHSNLRPIPAHVLQKPPSPCQSNVFVRLELLIRACSRATDSLDCVPVCAGRRGAHLVARLSELSAHIARLGLQGSPYPKLGHVGHRDDGPPSLRPYRDSDASRILIKGTGSWDLSRHLLFDPELFLPFRDPLVLTGIPENDLPYPDAAATAKETILPLVRLWDHKGLAAAFYFCSGQQKCSLLAGLHDRSRFYAAFGTLFQGDHGGVEYATSAHQALLREHGLLHPGSRLLGQHAVPRTPCYEALVIDDYFSLSVECLDDFAECPSEALPQKLLQAESTQRVLTAQAAYASENVQGPAKDLLGALTYQVAGAYVDSSVQSVREGQILVGAPPGKRLALAFLSLKASALPGISKELAAAFSGSWTSALLFRKPLAACLGSFFKLGLGHVSGHSGSDVVPLSRGQAQELVLLAVLSPIAVSNVALPHSKRIFCTDASLQKGAVVSARVSRPVAEALWAHASRRGQYTLLSGTTSLDPTDTCPSTAPSRGLTGRGPATESTLESPVGTCLADPRTRPLGLDFDWSLTFFFILSQTAAFAHSSAVSLLGLSPGSPTGSKERRALRALVLLRTCASYGVPCILVHQRKSGICRHPSFLRCLELQTATSASYRGCVFGGPGTSDLGWVAVWTPTPGLDRKCTCKFHEKGDDRSVFPSFSSEGARAIVSCLWAGAQLVEPPEEPACGFESALVNDVLLTSRWRADRTWRWRQRRHINVLESEAALQLYKYLVVLGGDLRFSLLTDSSVVLGSHRKGRSTAFLLAPSLRRASAILLAGGLYPSLQFAPTRLNPADDPTRDKHCREACGVPLHETVDPWSLASFSHLSRARANWVRLFLLVGSPRPSSPASRLRALWNFPRDSRFHCRCFSAQGRRLLDFDSTLGFPGEGPGLLWIFLTLWIYGGPCSVFGVLAPRNAADLLRQRGRAPGLLPSGRPVQPRTKANRGPLTAAFSQWLSATLEQLLQRRPFDHEVFCEYLVAFGNDLYASGGPYWHFAETINSLTSLKPSLRRQVQGAWDLAYTWLAEEPSVHHTAMPAQVLVAVLSTCLLWGWIKEAGIFALCWGALLRAGEAVKATRRDVVFPSDALWGQTYVLIKIQEPKTRGRAARHQSAKLEPYDLIEVCRLAFEALPKGAKLWPMTPQTLRRRLYDVLTRLGMPRSGGSERPLDLGSLRPGGATYLLQQTEDSELVRRRGRWISHRVMEIYLQEVSASTFLADLAPTARELVLAASSAFPDLLRKARDWTRAGIPPAVWFSLWPHL